MSDLEEIQDRVLYGISVADARELREVVESGGSLEDYLTAHPALKAKWDTGTELVADRRRRLGK